MTYQRFTDDVPESVVLPSDPEDESPEGEPIKITFDWAPGCGPRGLSGPPEFYDPGEPDEFVIIEPALDEDAENRVIDWLNDHWERPADDDGAEFLADLKRDDELLARAEEKGL